MFLVAPDDGKRRLRDLIRLSFLLFFLSCRRSLLLWFSQLSFFLRRALFFLLLYGYDCIRLLFLAATDSSRFFVLLFFLLRKLRTKYRERKGNTFESVPYHCQGKNEATDLSLLPSSFVLYVAVEKSLRSVLDIRLVFFTESNYVILFFLSHSFFFLNILQVFSFLLSFPQSSRFISIPVLCNITLL